jgi:hypothetical protein
MTDIRLPAKADIDLFLRILAFFLGLLFLMGALRVARDGHYPNITALFSAMAMFVCVVLPGKSSHVALIVSFFASVFAGFDFVVRAFPGLRNEGYPLDIMTFYLGEFAVIAWFFVKHVEAFREK